jgi:hypothetical protein
MATGIIASNDQSAKIAEEKYSTCMAILKKGRILNTITPTLKIYDH